MSLVARRLRRRDLTFFLLPRVFRSCRLARLHPSASSVLELHHAVRCPAPFLDDDEDRTLTHSLLLLQPDLRCSFPFSSFHNSSFTPERSATPTRSLPQARRVGRSSDRAFELPKLSDCTETERTGTWSERWWRRDGCCSGKSTRTIYFRVRIWGDLEPWIVSRDHLSQSSASSLELTLFWGSRSPSLFSLFQWPPSTPRLVSKQSQSIAPRPAT